MKIKQKTVMIIPGPPKVPHQKEIQVTPAAIESLMLRMAAAFNREYDKATLAVYARGLRNIPDDALEKLWDEIAAMCKYPPTIAEICALWASQCVGPNRAEELWALALDGSSLWKQDREAAAILYNLGGFFSIRTATTTELAGLRRAFIDNYNARHAGETRRVQLGIDRPMIEHQDQDSGPHEPKRIEQRGGEPDPGACRDDQTRHRLSQGGKQWPPIAT